MANNLYEILGVSHTATESEIKKAYRHKAMELHPDKHKGDKQIEEKFKEINKAYEILGDPQKKAAYDRFGETNANFGGSSGNNGGFQGFQNAGFDFNGMGADFGGAQGFSDIFEAFFTGFGAQRNAPHKGRNLEFELAITFEEAVFGTETELLITRPGKTGDKKQENLKVKIPAGVDNESIIRLTGKGDPGMNGGPTGDLYVHVRVRPHKEFVRNGPDLHLQTSISHLQAILGDQIKIKTLDNELLLKIPTGTQPGKVFKLRGYGVKKLHSGDKGDLYIKVNVQIPTRLSKKEKQLYKELADEVGLKPHNKGLFG